MVDVLVNCNSSKSLLGIETVTLFSATVAHLNCNSSKSLLGIETYIWNSKIVTLYKLQFIKIPIRD